MLINNSAQFAFRQRRERIDWKKIASVDIDRVAREVDFQILQDNAANVTFCDIQAEVDPSTMDLHFVKLFRLAQLIIEYLMYSQDCLSSALSSTEQKSSDLSDQLADLKEKLQKEEKKKISDKKSPFVFIDGGSQCKYCPKMFFNDTYLRLHLERRHPGQPLASKALESLVTNAPNADLENELADIKERLKTTENLLKEEKLALENASMREVHRKLQEEAEMRQEMESWKAGQLQLQKKELESMKEVFAKELDILNQQCLESEKRRQELQLKLALPAEKLDQDTIIAEEKGTGELIKKQQHEIAEMKELLKLQVAKVEEDVRQQMRNQEKHWKSRLKQLEREHNEEHNKLNEALSLKQQEIQQTFPDLELSLNRQIKELEKLNIRQKQHIEKQELQSGNQKELQSIISVNSPVKLHSMPIHAATAQTEDLSTTGETDLEHSLNNTRYAVAQSLAKLDSSIRHHNPIIIQGMRDEVSSLLDEKLTRFGISKDANGVKESAMESKLASQRNERHGLTKKYKSLLSIREQLQHQVDQIAQEKMKESRTGPSTHKRAKESIQKLFSSMRKKVKSIRTRSRSSSPAPFPRRISLSPVKTPEESPLEGTKQSTQETESEDDDEDDDGEDDDKLGSSIESSEEEEADIDRKAIAAKSVVGVPALARSLEQQFENRKQKPSGGVDLFLANKSGPLESAYKKESGAASKVDPTFNKLSSSLEDIFNTTSNANKRSKKETESSSNTAVTSAWGSSASKQIGAVKRLDTASRPSSSRLSDSSWDSKEEISDIS